jgi:hypothetical protein
MSYQQTKYMFQATTGAGKPVVLDYMQIEIYEVSDTSTENQPLIAITMQGGAVHIIEGDMARMKIIAGQIGIPIYPFGA